MMKNPNKAALLDAAAAVVEPALTEEQAAAVIGVPPSAMGKMRHHEPCPCQFLTGHLTLSARP